MAPLAFAARNTSRLNIIYPCGITSLSSEVSRRLSCLSQGQRGEEAISSTRVAGRQHTESPRSDRSLLLNILNSWISTGSRQHTTDFHTCSLQMRASSQAPLNRFLTDGGPSCRDAFSIPPAWVGLPAFQQRTYKGAGAIGSSKDEGKLPRPASAPPPTFHYHGAYSSTLRGVKLLSLSTCLLSLTLGPVVTFLTAPDVSVVAKGTIASLLMLLSASTTVGLHWFTSPYVHKLEWKTGEEEVKVQVLSWTTRLVEKIFNLSDVEYANTSRPLVSFAVKGSFYYIDKDAFMNAKLLEKLSPQEPTEGSSW